MQGSLMYWSRGRGRSRRHARWSVSGAVLVMGLVASGPARARPEAPQVVCEAYPDSASCRGRFVECSMCHTATTPAEWNRFGASLLPLLSGDDFEASLMLALEQVAGADADEDGIANEAEIHAGTAPGDDREVWCATPPKPAPGEPGAAADLALALRRVSTLFCGYAPGFAEQGEFAALSDEGARYERVHEVLTACLDSEFWRDIALPRLGDTKITPIFVYGRDSPAGVTLGDYEWDYRLFTYVLTGERDVRDLLRADYHVRRAEDGTLERVEGILPGDIDPPPPFGFPGGQPLAAEYRAGLLTTQWFLSYNTFLSGLPRGTAAQAYRAFFDYDIARLQGIRPIADEPADYDARDVDAPDCAVCHSTLDPLAYAFMEYEGIAALPGVSVGDYNPRRPDRLFRDWDDPTPWLFGQPVPDVLSWAEVAADSPDFRRMLGEMFFEYAFDREPVASELVDFDACWQALPELGWSANALIHCIVDLPSFAPGGAQ